MKDKPAIPDTTIERWAPFLAYMLGVLCGIIIGIDFCHGWTVQ